ncbi:molybdopterin molybdotransferase MoeA [Streptomyces sp. NPDC002574]|uniref:molybdopterin molybdotransferase MoeA n=1 Tax=Streptomyces sp. NPDC002574 TaxID=3364652 RepID=UPI0036CEEF2F
MSVPGAPGGARGLDGRDGRDTAPPVDLAAAEAAVDDELEQALALANARRGPLRYAAASPRTDGTAPAPHAPQDTDIPHPPHRPHPPRAHDDTSWPEARRIAAAAGSPLRRELRPLAQALGCALAEPLVALTDLPSFDTSAMDGWAVAGPGPWRPEGRVLAGERALAALPDGHATGIATGALLPAGTTAVLRSEYSRLGPDGLLHATRGGPGPGQDVRPRGQECRSGDELLATGALVTPAVLGLAAAAGYDQLQVTVRPTVEILVIGDELLDRGVPGSGRVRDALGPLLPAWLAALGADVVTSRRLKDDADLLCEAVTGSGADLVVTTGGTAGGPVDFVHPVLARIGARLLVDGVAVRPGHPMLLAELLGDGGYLVGLPGNPLAAVSGVLTLIVPLVRRLAGRPAPVPSAVRLTGDVPGHPRDTRLVPVILDEESRAVPLRFSGPAMLRGIATADGMAVIPPGGAAKGDTTAVLETGWGRL